jgi:hypothetical protein
MGRLLGVLFALPLLAGCQASVREQHFFFVARADSNKTESSNNYYRVTVKSDAYFSNARYLSGVYDDDALNLFFGESGSKPTKVFPVIAKDGSGAPNENKRGPGEGGAMVLILSTNADAIADTIGAFADNKVVADALSQLANKRELTSALKDDASAGPLKTAASASTDEIKSLINDVPSDKLEAKQHYIDILNTLARELGFTGTFESMSDARLWLNARKEL